MLIWISALRCEAKPVIDFYRLKKSAEHHAFDLYRNENIACVISGIGKTAVATATTWVATLFHGQSNIAWINLGSAGADSDAVGEIFWINKVSDGSGRHYFPVSTFKTGFESRSCLTLDAPGTDYHQDYLFDMEASAFFSTATRSSSAELVHCLKVISDNQHQSPSRDKAAMSRLMENHIESLSDFAEKLRALGQSSRPIVAKTSNSKML